MVEQKLVAEPAFSFWLGDRSGGRGADAGGPTRHTTAGSCRTFPLDTEDVLAGERGQADLRGVSLATEIGAGDWTPRDVAAGLPDVGWRADQQQAWGALDLLTSLLAFPKAVAKENNSKLGCAYLLGNGECIFLLGCPKEGKPTP
eukprot:Sspe_Gene.855::Locus_286_Transcript_5_10_Confidence_0.522_Length_849::g.855::m.855